MAGTNKVKFGLKNMHFAVVTDSATSYTYASVKSQVGAVSLSLTKQGEVFKKYADDTEFFSKSKNNGYSGTLAITDLSDDFITNVLGWTKDSKGVIIETSSDSMKHFALGFEIQGDAKARKIWLYDCYIERPSLEANTQEESMSTTDESLTIYAIPRTTDGKVRAVCFADDEAYSSFFDSVYETTASV